MDQSRDLAARNSGKRYRGFARRARAQGVNTLPRACAGQGGVSIASADGALSFRLIASEDALVVVRSQRVDFAVLQEQAFVLTSREQLLRWLEREPLRFDDPVLHERIRRSVSAHWNDAD